MEGKYLSFPYLPDLEVHLQEGDADAVINMLDAQGHRQTIDIVNWESQFPYRPLTAVSVAHSGKHLFLDFFVRCNYMRAVNSEMQSNVWEDSSVVFVVSPGRDDSYLHFAFNCIGAINAAMHNAGSTEPLDNSALERVVCYASCGTRPFCELEGLFTWNLLVAIPLDLLGVEYKGQPLEMTANFYKCATMTSAPHYLTWSRVESDKPDFHRPEFFCKIRLD